MKVPTIGSKAARTISSTAVSYTYVLVLPISMAHQPFLLYRVFHSCIDRLVPLWQVHRPVAVGTQRAGGTRRALGGGKQRNEIFVDILERLNVLFRCVTMRCV